MLRTLVGSESAGLVLIELASGIPSLVMSGRLAARERLCEMRSRLHTRLGQAVVLVLHVALVPALLAGAQYKVLHNFGAPRDGTQPFGSLLLDEAGRLYGSTYTGGTGSCSDYGCGTVFELERQANGTWKETILHSFTAGSSGAFPWGALIFDGSANLYGTMSGSGGFAVGGVFELTPSSHGWTYNILYDNGAAPGLLADSLGNLYGDIGPGRRNAGGIGELSRGSQGWNYSLLYSYCGPFSCPDGVSEPAPPVWDANRNLFGVTRDGGIYQPACTTALGCGVIFEMTPYPDGTWTYHVLHRFASYPTDGQIPSGGLVMDKSGNLYGTTLGAGPLGTGEVFKLSFTAGRWKKTVVYDFPDCNNGCGPVTTPVFDKAGNLYGEASGGYNCGGGYCGTVWKLAPQTNGKWSYTLLHKFSPNTGVFPEGVIVDGKGHLFGTTLSGGKYDFGVAFEITP